MMEVRLEKVGVWTTVTAEYIYHFQSLKLRLATKTFSGKSSSYATGPRPNAGHSAKCCCSVRTCRNGIVPPRCAEWMACGITVSNISQAISPTRVCFQYLPGIQYVPVFSPIYPRYFHRHVHLHPSVGARQRWS